MICLIQNKKKNKKTGFLHGFLQEACFGLGECIERNMGIPYILPYIFESQRHMVKCSLLTWQNTSHIMYLFNKYTIQH